MPFGMNEVARRIGKMMLVLLFLSAGACSKAERSGEFDLSAAWSHRESQEDGVSIVQTTAGSLWRGRAQLREEFSLGSETGPQALVFGQVSGIAEWEGRLFVLDSKAVAFSMFDLTGRHLRDIGVKGQGPGEFGSASSLVVQPRDGRLFVQDESRGRIVVFSPGGEYLESWPITPWPGSLDMAATRDGTFYLREITTDPATGVMNLGPTMAGFGPGGPTGKALKIAQPDFKPSELVYMRRGRLTARTNVPFSPRAYWNVSPSGALIHGVSDDYRFDVEPASGPTIRIIKKWDRVSVEPTERDWHVRALTGAFRRVTPGWTWDGPALPKFKPAYRSLFADFSGRIWVFRQGPGRRVQDCRDTPAMLSQYFESPCWIDGILAEVFEENGRFLGAVDLPEGFSLSPPPFIREDVVLAVVRGSDGVDLVKRFRLIVPKVPLE